MSSDYSYDEEGTLWPFFVFTLSGLVTLPLTYVLYKGTRDPAASFPRIKSAYRPKDAEVIVATRKKDKRKDNKLWLVFLVVLGWSVMAYTMYLIYVTPATVRSIWNPYDILGISEVWIADRALSHIYCLPNNSAVVVRHREGHQEHLQEAVAHLAPGQGPTGCGQE